MEQARITEQGFNKTYVYTISSVVALGAILFGFDMVIISDTVPFFTDFFKLNETSTGWARLLSAVAVGLAALVCPMYIAEVAPASMRGRLVTFYQLAIVSGLLLAYLSNYLLLNSGVNNWRWMFSSQTIPSLLFFVGLFFVPESPRWLIKKERKDDALDVFSKIGGKEYACEEVSNVKNSFVLEVKEKISDLFKADVKSIVFIGGMVAIFSQAVGQNSLFSYTPVIFQQAGVAAEAAFLQSVIIGVVNFVFTFVAMLIRVL